MGGVNTKEEIVARLDKLDREEIHINKELRELQIELNGIVPVKDRVKVKKEYFDNISKGELEKHQENQYSNSNSDSIEDENLEDLEKDQEEDEDDDDIPKRRNKKKIKNEKEQKRKKNNSRKKRKKNKSFEL